MEIKIYLVIYSEVDFFYFSYCVKSDNTKPYSLQLLCNRNTLRVSFAKRKAHFKRCLVLLTTIHHQSADHNNAFGRRIRKPTDDLRSVARCTDQSQTIGEGYRDHLQELSIVLTEKSKSQIMYYSHSRVLQTWGKYKK